jgi:hypothetical protein
MITRARDLLWVMAALVLAFYIGSLKSLLGKAYKDKPMVAVGLMRHGRKQKLNIKIYRHGAKNHKNN